MNWITVKEYEDITYKKCNGVARIAFNRPDVRNAFSSKTTSELYSAFYDAQEDNFIGVGCLLKVLHQKMESTFVVVEIKMHVVIRVM
jgi:1,4-dihydroxy-2-naphthoyl-CoA synthase